jgi:hypothetical protein
VAATSTPQGGGIALWRLLGSDCPPVTTTLIEVVELGVSRVVDEFLIAFLLLESGYSDEAEAHSLTGVAALDALLAASTVSDAHPADAEISATRSALEAEVVSELTRRYGNLPGVVSVTMVSVTMGDGRSPASVHAEIVVARGSNTANIVEALKLIAYEVLRSDVLDLSAIVDDGTTVAEYLWSNEHNGWLTTQINVTPTATAPLPTSTLLRRTLAPTSPPPQTDVPETYYTTQNANARSCPRTTCARVMTIQAGTAVSVIDTENGEAVSGSTTWMHVLYDGREMYIHSSLLSTTRPQPRPTSPPSQGQQPPAEQPTQVQQQPSPEQPTQVQQQAPTQPPPPVSTQPPQPQGASCGGASTCGEMSSCEQAYACLAAGDSGLDRDHDGVPCESICPGG